MSDTAIQPRRNAKPRAAAKPRGRRGFTIVELLVTIAIIVALLGLLLVGLNQASEFSKVAKTRTLMQSITAALGQFKADTGYYPPVLGVGSGGAAGVASLPGTRGFARDLLVPPTVANPNNPTGAELAAVNGWWSVTSLPDFLLGYDNRAFDGYGFDDTAPLANSPGSRELPPLGIRHPGRDGLWGAVLEPRVLAASSIGYYRQRNPGGGASGNANSWNSSGVRGKVLGPYLELKDGDMVGGISGVDGQGEPIVHRAEETPNFDLLPKCFIDYWGRPIRFYRRGYNALDPSSVSTDFSLGDVVALRPMDFAPGTEADGFADANGDTTTSRALLAAEFALVSTGPDRTWAPSVRYDTAETNVDNIVEIGP